MEINSSSDPVTVYLDSLSPGSRRTMSESLNIVAHYLGKKSAKKVKWNKLKYSDTAMIRALLVESYSPATCRKIIAAVRGVLKMSWKLNLMSSSDYQRAVDIDTVRGVNIPPGRRINRGELIALFQSCNKTPRGSRDAALMAVLYGTGIRRRELIELNFLSYESEEKCLLIEGKGSKQRRMPLQNNSCDALNSWITHRGTFLGPLFLSIKGSRIINKQLSGQAVYWIIKSRANKACISDISPHDFRRTFVSDLLDAGVDLSTVQRLAGHAKQDTTARYDRRGEGTLRSGAELLSIPFINGGV
jgi:site-specific recombinase XerD